MKNIKLNYKKIASQITSIHEIAKKGSWIPYYDEELDEFYMAPESIDGKYFLQEIGKEFLVYVDEKSNVGGVFIEYFQNNLSSHDAKFKPFKKIVKEGKKFNKENTTILLSTIESALLEAILPKIQTA